MFSYLVLPFANFFFNQNGNVLLSQAVSHQVSSALRSLTSVFGMGTGVTSSLLSPHFLLVFSSCCCVAAYSIVSHILKYAPSSLARAPCIRIKIHRNSFWVCSIAPSKLNNICLKLPSSFALPWNLWSSFRPISIGQLHTLLHFHLRPINVIVSHGSYL